jgi:hypothetical protein
MAIGGLPSITNFTKKTVPAINGVKSAYIGTRSIAHEKPK